jgi:CheY-like chemotaxis protein
MESIFMKPIREEEPDRARKAYASDARHRVLLIDDHLPLAEATAEFMQESGLEVRIATTGEEALGMVSTFRPEIVLCDLNLPDMPGPDVARALRGTPAAKDSLIVIHSAMNESDLSAACREIGPQVNMLLSKPLTDDKLRRLLSELEILQRSRRRDAVPGDPPR